MKLSDTQLVILNTAANRPTQDVAKDTNVKPQGFAAAMRGIIDKGLVNRTKPKTEIDGSYVMKTDDGSFSFVLNTNAYVALAMEPDATVTVPKPSKGIAKIKAEPAESEDGEEGDEDSDDGIAKSGMMKKEYHDRYMAQGGGCGDNVDLEMRAAFTIETIEKYVTKKGEEKERKISRVDIAALREFGEEIELWNEKWENFNPGAQRMNLANRIRGAIRNGAVIKLGKTVLTTPMPEPKQKKEKKARAKKG